VEGGGFLGNLNTAHNSGICLERQSKTTEIWEESYSGFKSRTWTSRLRSNTSTHTTATFATQPHGTEPATCSSFTQSLLCILPLCDSLAVSPHILYTFRDLVIDMWSNFSPVLATNMISSVAGAVY